MKSIQMVRNAEETSNLDGHIEQIVKRGLEGQTIDEQLKGFANLLSEAGFPVKWVCISMRTLHPRFGALTYIWRAADYCVEYRPQQRTDQEHFEVPNSPLKLEPKTSQSIKRYRLDGDDNLEFSILEELRCEAMTDYAASIVRYGSDSQGVILSYATNAKAGFHPAQLQQVFALQPHFAMAIKSRLTFDVASIVAKTYLGKDAGRRVLTGEIDRGATQSIRAVIWYFDLQSFTQLAETNPGFEMIAMLNEYFGAVVGTVESYGGDVLKFMGDGLLAIFKFADDESACCSRVIAAADELLHAMELISDSRKAGGLIHTKYSLALHIGDLMYGNIGAEDRLDFTVIGPAVNMVARIQTMCRPLEQDLIISAAMVNAIIRERKRIISIGHHRLRGISDSEELFTLDRLEN